jgi:hypothetical protein
VLKVLDRATTSARGMLRWAVEDDKDMAALQIAPLRRRKRLHSTCQPAELARRELTRLWTCKTVDRPEGWSGWSASLPIR